MEIELNVKPENQLNILSFKKEFGFTLDQITKRLDVIPCSVCGVFRRYLLNKNKNFDVLATGHNLDDTVETLFNFYLEGNIEGLLRLKPSMPKIHPKMVPKIKPLIGLTDMECLLYAGYRDLPVRVIDCQFSKGSRMLKRKELLNMITDKIPNFKHSFMNSHFKRILPLIEKACEKREVKLYECTVCGMPTSLEGASCRFCKLVEMARGRKREG